MAAHLSRDGVTQAIADNGGARKVVAGGAGFCACLTRSGKVVVWGSLPGLPGPDTARRSGGVCATEVLPMPFESIGEPFKQPPNRAWPDRNTCLRRLQAQSVARKP